MKSCFVIKLAESISNKYAIDEEAQNLPQNELIDEQNYNAVDFHGGPARYFSLRAREILETLSGSMLEANKIPLLENALMQAFKDGLTYKK